jgi:hypothetical protein
MTTVRSWNCSRCGKPPDAVHLRDGGNGRSCGGNTKADRRSRHGASWTSIACGATVRAGGSTMRAASGQRSFRSQGPTFQPNRCPPDASGQAANESAGCVCGSWGLRG